MKHILNFSQFVNESMLNEGAKTKDFEKLIKPFSDLKLTPESTRTPEFKNGLMQELGVNNPGELSYIKINLGDIDILDNSSTGDEDSANDVIAMFLEGNEEEYIATAVWWEPKAKFVKPGADEDDLDEEEDDDPKTASAAKKRNNEYEAAEKWHTKNFYNSVKVYHDEQVKGLKYAVSYTENKVKRGDRVLIFPTDSKSKLIKAFKMVIN
jgi:hypothetical protein